MGGMTSTSRVLPLLLGGAILGLGGCGGGGSNDSAGGSTPAGGDDEAQLAFAACMREQGVEVSDPDGSGRVRIEIRAKPGQEFSPRKVREATADCRAKTGGGPREPTDAEKTELRDQALKFAACLREHGVDVPDPGSGNGGGLLLRRGAAGIDPNSSTFKKAEAACRDLMPTLGASGSPGGQAGGDGATGGASSGAAAVPAP